MYRGWTRDEILESWKRFYRIYKKNPMEYRCICGHDIQFESDTSALDYYIIGVWLICHRKYRDWTKEKAFDLAWILEFMQEYRITIPRYIRRTKFYRKKIKQVSCTLCSEKRNASNDMEFNLKEFQKELAEQKVYDAWQYVTSLHEMLTYMDMSCVLIERVYAQRRDRLQQKEREIKQQAGKEGQATVSKNDLQCTNLKIANVEIDDTLFLQKTTMEFFHYARLCIDILFQIINAALLGDRALKADYKYLMSSVNNKLDKNASFKKLKSMLDENKANNTFKYIQDFDNYIKHIKTVLITVKNSFMFGNQNEFMIRSFVNGQVSYPEKDAVTTVREADRYIHKTTENILAEVKRQLPNCLDNSHRIHDISFKFVAKKVNDGIYPEYLSFFIEVQENIDELPSEVKIRPLIVKPNGSIAEFDFKFDKIFIKKKGTDEDKVIGCAEIKNGFDTNEFYRVFTVRSCGRDEYIKYVGSFMKKYPSGKFNMQAMHGEIIVDPE